MPPPANSIPAERQRPHALPHHVTLDSVRRTYGRYAPWYDWLFGAVLEPGRRRLTQAASRRSTSACAMRSAVASSGQVQ